MKTFSGKALNLVSISFRYSNFPNGRLSQLIILILALSGCAKEIEILDAEIEYAKKEVILKSTLSKGDALFLMQNRFVVYSGVGECGKPDTARYESSYINGMSLPLSIGNVEDIELDKKVDLVAKFSTEDLRSTECAFLKIAGMNLKRVRTNSVAIN